MSNLFKAGDYIGKYKIEQRLGRGGMAEVYKAYHPQLDRFVAIKIMHAHLAEEPNFLERFQREARNMAATEHPHIIHVYDFDVEKHYYYIVMEHLSGGTLKDQIDQLAYAGRTMPLTTSIRILLELADALSFAHGRGMIHRDIKPANVMFNDRQAAVLTDFGIAKLTTAATHNTNTGAMVGTPAYMSPEQGLGEAGDERSDLYSLGVLAYQLFTGRLPHDGETPLAVILKHVNDTPIRPSLIVDNLPAEVEKIILKAMEKNPDQRYQTASQMARDIRQLIREGSLAGFGTIDGLDDLMEKQEIPDVTHTGRPRKTPAFSNGDALPPTLLGKLPGEHSRPDAAAVMSLADTLSSDQPFFSAAVPDQKKKSPIPTPPPAANETPAPTNMPGELSATLQRLSSEPAPIISTGQFRRVNNRLETYKKEKKSQRWRRVMFTTSLLAGVALGIAVFWLVFLPGLEGESAAQQFNRWLNRQTGGTTADEVNLDGLEADPPTAPGSGLGPSDGAVWLQLTGLPADAAGWTIAVQARTAESGWETIEGWQGDPDENGAVGWPADQETPPGEYRWAVFPPAGGTAVTSEPFTLPLTGNANPLITLAVANP